jgi:hypothetical protein
MNHAALFGALNFLRRGVVGQVQRHQWFELRTRRQRGNDARAISECPLGGSDRRPEIGHDDGTGKLPRGIRQYRLHQRAVAQMQMPVVRAGKGELLHDVFRLDVWVRL